MTKQAAGRPTCSPGWASVTSSGPPGPDTHPAITAGGYVALFLLGMVQGLIGTFQYSRGPGVLVAILFDAAILATCMLGARGMRTALGGVLPALGWFVVTVVLSSSNSAGGSVIVTNTAAGKWFLFGGSLCAAAGAVYAFARWSRATREHRERSRG